jgi:hypothetical protein
MNADDKPARPPQGPRRIDPRIKEPGELSEEILEVVSGGLDEGAALENANQLLALLNRPS